MKSFGSEGVYMDNMSCVHYFTVSQNSLSLQLHCQRQRKRKPLSFSYLLHISSIATLYLLSFPGVTYVPFKQLYCSNLKRAFCLGLCLGTCPLPVLTVSVIMHVLSLCLQPLYIRLHKMSTFLPQDYISWRYHPFEEKPAYAPWSHSMETRILYNVNT